MRLTCRYTLLFLIVAFFVNLGNSQLKPYSAGRLSLPWAEVIFTPGAAKRISAKQASTMGYRNVKVYRGGISDWWRNGRQPLSISADYLHQMMKRNVFPVVIDIRPQGLVEAEGFIPG